MRTCETGPSCCRNTVVLDVRAGLTHHPLALSSTGALACPSPAPGTGTLPSDGSFQIPGAAWVLALRPAARPGELASGCVATVPGSAGPDAGLCWPLVG